MNLSLDQLVQQANEQFNSTTKKAILENIKSKFLGKKGAITTLIKEWNIEKLDYEKRRKIGIDVNKAKKKIEELLVKRRTELDRFELDTILSSEFIDVTLSGRGRFRSGIHPIMKSLEKIEQIFHSIGFDIADGPEIETDWVNFTALNSPIDHPARSMQDTFYIDIKDDDGLPLLLRTHTSSVQVRYAMTHEPPIKIISSGRVYRVDNDATHSPIFHQVEGLWIAENISFSDLKSVYINFLHCFFERNDLVTRFRPSFFPFTEPSAEVDMQFTKGPNCGKWLEISGLGQIHPQVIKNFDLDPERYTGFAFGTGLERLTMLQYGIDDLRQFYEGDIYFLNQFNE